MTTASPPAAAENHTDVGPGFRKVIWAADTFANWWGVPTGWLIIPMTVAVTWEVVSRKLGHPTDWAFDVTYMLYGTHFMLGTAYTLMKVGHVRTDMLYAKWSVRRQSWIDAIGYLVFFFPAMVAFLWYGGMEAAHSWSIGETSDASPWRPIVYPFKAVIPVTAFLLMVQGIAELLKSIYGIRTGRVWVKREMMEIG